MICIVGLGNPGDKYKNNRHNVGFQFIDYLINEYRINGLMFDKYLNAQFVNTLIDNKEYILAKPQTFMNKSGEAVSKLMRNLKLKIRNLVVVHDDLDIPLGKFKIQKGTGPQLHNGIESIENHLHTKDFWRIRIGVDARLPDRWVDGETYVLHDFIKEEFSLINHTFSLILRALEQRKELLA